VLATHRWRTAANSAAYLLPHLAPGMSLLDVGCGPGTITRDLARAVAPARVVGLDNVEAPLLEASTAAGDVDFRLGDAYALEFEDDSFDVVHAHQVLHHLTDPVAALREMRRVCRPGGIVAVRETDYSGATWFPAYYGFQVWLDVFRAISRGNGAEPDAGRRLKSWAREAGFTDITTTASVWCFTDPGDRTYWAGSWGERVVSSAFADQALERGLATRAQLERIKQAFDDWAADDDGWFTILHGEVLCRP
jgi:ubiquinone/menaquinone biosynthesis C-methylase UbiE